MEHNTININGQTECERNQNHNNPFTEFMERDEREYFKINSLRNNYSKNKNIKRQSLQNAL